ncbi:NfeD family protein [Legionella sp. CNM-4043-24]|uniref:NfeD family protein n=1 Tax=Legionella sp. CNM-4043-24 TaxID=3421646 RepID=UPI00403B0478
MEWLVYWHWFTLALVLIIAEIMGAAGFLLALGTAAATTGLLTWLMHISWQWQLVIFSTLCILYAFAWWQYLQSRAVVAPTLLNRPVDEMMGRTTTLIEAIVDGRGKILINGTTWFVTGPELPAGTRVTITAIQGDTLLVVEPVSS